MKRFWKILKIYLLIIYSRFSIINSIFVFYQSIDPILSLLYQINLFDFSIDLLYLCFDCVLLFIENNRFTEFSSIIFFYSTIVSAFYFQFKFSIFIRSNVRPTFDIERKSHYNMLIFLPFLPYKLDIHKPCSQLYIYHKGMCCKDYDNSSKQPLACEHASHNHESILCI